MGVSEPDSLPVALTRPYPYPSSILPDAQTIAKMVERYLLNGIVGIVVIALTGLLALPGLRYVLSKTRIFSSYAPVAELYEDEDGTSTEESVKAYSDTRPRIAAWLIIILGLGTAIADRVLTLLLHDASDPAGLSAVSAVSVWSDLVSWVSAP